jgi:hypothetical protein
MKFTKAPPIFSRIVLAVSALVMVGVVFIFVSRAIEPANIIPATKPKKAEAFNPKADVSKHPTFVELDEAYMDPVPDMPIGRENPFNSIVTPAAPKPSEGVAVPRSQLKIAPIATTTTDAATTTETSYESPTN